ncbi:hypothetical protein MFLAVUS_011525 [Mucor flavus]|uniref:Retrotransposon gag domain-containing protein n=1 Tax=Mucor flavus TaxID=439312 RepID=A0ABP9ZFQ1_9FUNG
MRWLCLLIIWDNPLRVEFAKLYQRDPLWLEFTSAFRFRYGINAEEERNNCAEMKANETLDLFIDRFNDLRRRSVEQVLPNYLSPSPGHSVTGLVAPRTPKRTVVESDASEIYHRSSNLSRHATNNSRASNSGRGQHNASVTIVPAQASNDMYCSFHRTKTHNTSDCRAASASGTNTAPNNRTCHKCGALGWTPSHQCRTATRSSAVSDNVDGLTFGAMTKVRNAANEKCFCY